MNMARWCWASQKRTTKIKKEFAAEKRNTMEPVCPKLCLNQQWGCLSVTQYGGWTNVRLSVTIYGEWRPGSKGFPFVRHGKWWSTFWGEQRANRNRSWPFIKQRTIVLGCENVRERGKKKEKSISASPLPECRLPNIQYRYLPFQ